MRRPTIRWTSPPDEASAADAVSEITAWLEGLPEPPDWAGVLGPVREGLFRLVALPALRADIQARALLLDLANATDPDALDATLEALRRRAEALVQARRGAAEDWEWRDVDSGPGPRARTRLRL